jgi:hypothetical protein
MELINKIKECIRTNTTSRLMFITGLCGTFAFLTIIYFLSRTEINEVDKFVKKQLDGVKILTVTETKFQSARGTYKKITMADNPDMHYSAMVSAWDSHDLGENIVVGARITKDSNSRQFKIQNGDNTYIYGLSNPTNGMLIFMTIVTVMSLGMTALLTIVPTLEQIKIFK